MSEKKYSEFITNESGKCRTIQDLIDDGTPLNEIPKGGGIYNTPTCRTPFLYDAPEGCWSKSNQGAYISMGQIPPGGLATGYGAKGIPADAIDLVVGRNASSNGGDGPKEGAVVSNNFLTDAARIYISRLCDIDIIFGIATDNPAVSWARSGIGIKADGVRIHGREGVKIITGKMDNAVAGIRGESNSMGGAIMPAPKIDLIAGNCLAVKSSLKSSTKIEDQLQGVALGERTQMCIAELAEVVGEIWTAVFNMTLTQIPTNASLVVTPWAAGAVATSTSQQLTGVASLLYQSRANAMLWKNRFIGAPADKYIVSKNVRTN